MKSICVISSTRADYGILSRLLRRIYEDPELELRLVATGTHLAPAYGNTIEEIRRDGFSIHAAIPILETGDTPQAVSATMARTLTGFGAYFSANRPDFALVLGDRYEICAACMAAVNTRVPIAHLHGGETTEGAVDECFRHAITKMSYLHFTANETYRKRVIQLGEAPERVFNVGALGVENALHTDFMLLEALEGDLQFNLSAKPFAVVTFHPVTLEEGMVQAQLEELLYVLAKRRDMRFLITKSNADAGGGAINAALEAFGRKWEHCKVVASLGMRRYMSALKYAACVIGNSSSGLVEAPSFGIPTINIGDRQRGRMQAGSVINCAPARDSIERALDKALSPAFRQVAARAVNPYGSGNTSVQVCGILKDVLQKGNVNLKKKFYDVEFL